MKNKFDRKYYGLRVMAFKKFCIALQNKKMMLMLTCFCEFM